MQATIVPNMILQPRRRLNGFGDGSIIDTLETAASNKIQTAAGAGATAAVEPYIMGGLAISLGACLLSAGAYLMSKEALKRTGGGSTAMAGVRFTRARKTTKRRR